MRTSITPNMITTTLMTMEAVGMEVNLKPTA